MSLLDIPTDIEAITEYGLTGAAHDTELSAQARQVLHLRGLSRSLRNARAATRAAEHVAQDLAKDITARDLRTGRGWRRLPARRGDLDGELDGASRPSGQWHLSGSASNDHVLDTALLDPLLQLLQDLTKYVAAGSWLRTGVGRSWKRLPTRRGNRLRA